MATLKISDLSVGDWVEYEGLHYPITFVGYGEGGDGSLVNLTRLDLSCFTCKISDIHPIPITAEILENNGFEEDNNGHYALKIGGIVAVDIEYTGGIWELSILDVYALQYAGKMQVTIAFVSSIHSLQHALRLAGVDKEINF